MKINMDAADVVIIILFAGVVGGVFWLVATLFFL